VLGNLDSISLKAFLVKL